MKISLYYTVDNNRDQEYTEVMKNVKLENSDVVLRAHEEDACFGEFCTIHNRSDHSMRSFPQHWRSDRAIMERINPFGGACPDPDEYKLSINEYEGIHGCIINPYEKVGMCQVWHIDNIEAAWINESYAITKDGRVWSFIKTGNPSNNNNSTNDYTKRPKEIIQKNNGKGYMKVSISINNKIETKYVHRLVLNAWKGECPHGYEARHLDGNKKNNSLENLEWSSKSENNMDKWKHGTMMHGSSHINSKLTKQNVIDARNLWKNKELTLQNIKDVLMLDVSKSTLHEAITGKTWNWI